MTDPIYEIKENPTYETEIRALQDSDKAQASTVFNPLLEKMINNTHAVKKQAERVEEDLKTASVDLKNVTVNQENKVDKETGKGLSTEDYTTAEKNKLKGIAEEANSYTHPSSHAASMITEDTTHRFITDAERISWNKVSDKVDKETGKGLSSEDYTTTEKNKLKGIAEGANNYTHPSSHAATIITEDTTHRFITDAERISWNKVSNKVDKETGKGLSAEDYTTAEKNKLKGIAEEANNYTHPSSHAATIITEDTTHRFITDAERSSWNNKVDSDGDVSATKISSLDTTTDEFPVPAAGETIKTFMGKVRKFFQDFNDFRTGIITVGKLVNNGQTTASGYALDARYGKTLADQIAQLNSDLPILKDGEASQTAGTENYTITNILPVIYGRVLLVRLIVHCVKPSSSLMEISNNLPATSRGVNGTLVDYNSLPMRISLDAEGSLKCQGGTAGRNYYGHIVTLSKYDI